MSTKKFCDATGEEIPLNSGIEVVVSRVGSGNTKDAWKGKDTHNHDGWPIHVEDFRYHFKSWDVVPLQRLIDSNYGIIFKVTMFDLRKNRLKTNEPLKLGEVLSASKLNDVIVKKWD